MATTSDIKKGAALKFKGEICLVTEFQHVNPGKGGSFVRTRIKNVKTGKVLEETFKSSETIDMVALDKKGMQFLYQDQAGFHFMDPESYEQVSMSGDDVGEDAGFLKEGQEVALLLHEGVPITLELPKKLTLKVVTAPPGVKGDTASGRVTKEIELEGGVKIQAPLFINEGDKIVVNTETREYVERA
jgi:elongation factor P